jgi:hypothetical protein
MKKQGKFTAGELLARQLSGDTTITDKDIEDATSNYFAQFGIDCRCKVGSFPEAKKDD